MMKKQQGLSFFGFIIVAMAVAMALITAFKVVPTYIEYFNIKQALTTIAKQNSGATPAAIRESYVRHADISNIHAIKPEDLIITQVAGRTVIRTDYEQVVPLVANVSFLFQFSIETSSSGPSE
ncbi:DUF4845 domain-containing protein [Chitinibacter bivalviorum]|uniref:DUF4845 domain-containing protein n=1 Tax=Chitinibacter bivalviorum TaxID=2739434 RepID=A0A7H9BGW8_9NEIS|nr:DUF4845 domain-containing protein [Chitinibacter bivalviorum]QLG87960.1 DUF4845 domain-containing protein [Chitinibacter bivalviorum]